jgi:dipeptidyl aminopeptidase/acylaminoacyl peptidase
VPFALIEFPDEGHGFRRAANVVRALEAELSFFADRFGFEPADDLPPLAVEDGGV